MGLMRMRMKMQKMTNVNGRTGASGLADAARSLADALEFKLEAGPLTISCLTRACGFLCTGRQTETRTCKEEDCGEDADDGEDEEDSSDDENEEDDSNDENEEDNSNDENEEDISDNENEDVEEDG